MGTLISNDNGVEKEIQRRVLACDRTYFAAMSLLRSRLLPRATKIVLYKTLRRPVVSYGAEVFRDFTKSLLFQTLWFTCGSCAIMVVTTGRLNGKGRMKNIVYIDAFVLFF